MKMTWIDGNNKAIDSFSVRKKVFILEQGFNEELEIDDIDKTAYHLCLYTEEKKPIAAARLFVENGSFHCGRICVLKEYRKLGIGEYIMNALEQKTKELGGSLLVLSSQLQAQPFYEKCGFVSEGEVYLDELCPHIKMTLAF